MERISDAELAAALAGYWDTQGTEIDMVAVDENNKRIRFGTCKRSAEKLEASLSVTDGHIQRFLCQRPHPHYAIEKVAIAPQIDAKLAKQLGTRGWLVEDLRSLTIGL